MWHNAGRHRAAVRGRQARLTVFVAVLTLLAGAGSASRAQSLPQAESAEGLITVDAAAVVAPTTAAGRTPTEFGVSHSGAATYRIPLWTPPGIGDVELNLALVYSSRGGGTSLGAGWALEGLSNITRCNRIHALDGFAAAVSNTTSDRYCLDGQPLKLVSGTAGTAGAVYATAIESFSRIVANGSAGNGPASFTVTTRNGLVYEYGSTADSRIFAGNTPTVRAWALARVRDRAGNAIALTYANEAQSGAYTNGTHRIAAITYPTTATGMGPYYRVDFEYSLRPASDVPTGFLAGNRVREPYQLDRIAMQALGAVAPIKSYSLTYGTAPVTGRLRLGSVQECGASTCLQPTTITYQDGSGGWQPMVETGVSPSAGKPPVPLDLNGDGMQDILYPVAAGNGRLSWRFLLATPTGFSTPIDTGVVTNSPHMIIPGAFAGNGRTQFLVQQGGYWHVAGYTPAGTFAVANTGLLPAGEYAAADFDGDGLADLVGLVGDTTFFARRNTTTPSVSTLSASFAGSTQSIWTMGSARRSNGWDNVRMADLNGDARADLVLLTYIPSDRNPRFFATTFLSSGPGMTFTFGSEWQLQPESMVTMGDWNADGCSDIVQWSEVYLSNCAGSFTLIGTGATLATGNWVATVIPADWNGDGRSDLLYIDSATKNWFVVRSTGEGAVPPINTGIQAPLATTWLDLDANGDGLTDLAYVDGLNGNRLRFHAHAGVATPPDLATSFTDGFGVTHAPTYASIARSSHTRRNDAVFPAVDHASPLYVVSAVSATDGIGGTYRMQFSYEGARVHMQGLGFQGFAQQRIVDSRLGLITVDETARDYPFTGMHVRRSVFQPNGTTPIRQWQAQTGVQTRGLGSEQRLFPFVASTTEKQYEVAGTLNGSLVSETARSFTFSDMYGNPTQVQTTLWDRDPTSPYYNSAWRSSISQSYANDASNWCLGLPVGRISTTTAPNQPAMTRTSTYTVDTTACRVTQETLEPNVPALRKITGYSFDGCGNLATIAVTGAKPDGSTMPARSTRFNHGARCQFVESIVNAASETTTYAWNADFGVPTRATDANGLVTQWSIDEYGRRVGELAPDGTRVTYTFQSCGTSGCWRSADRRFATFERQYAADDSLVRERHTYYDAYDRARLIDFHGALGTWLHQTFDFDAAGRPVRESRPYAVAQ
ncbi:MAG: FG-GAP-like repeat-containing protein, partial [Gammaproteobacteria bacterium]|nr:FG-GAP-like repeat-containing protein [Gammaproteobacteria bacterium]